MSPTSSPPARSAGSVPSPAHPFPAPGEPVWDLALMYPLQGGWSVEDYLHLDTGMLVEFTDGFIRVLPMPNILHQWIVRLLFDAFHNHVRRHGLGEVFFAPLPVQLTTSKYREPDIVFVRPERIGNLADQPVGADLVVEVVSEGKESRQRDYVDKRREYAEAAIAEYWIVDPEDKKVTVLTLDGSEYVEHGVFLAGDRATSALFSGFSVEVDDVFAKCDEDESL